MDNDIIEIARILVSRENLVPEIDMYDFLSDAEKEPYITMAKMLNPENHKELMYNDNLIHNKLMTSVRNWDLNCRKILNERDKIRGVPFYNFLCESTAFRTKIIAIKEKLLSRYTMPKDGSEFVGLIYDANFLHMKFVNNDFHHNTTTIIEQLIYGWKYCD